MPTRTPPTLQAALEGVLDVAVAEVSIERSLYSSSFPIDDVHVTLEDGSLLRIVRKDLTWAALLPAARRGKPVFVHDPRREMRMYLDVLPAAPPGTAQCLGVVDEPAIGRRWLFLERLDGVELFQVGDLDRWCATARWIARLHRQFEGRAMELMQLGVPLLVHDRRWLLRWADRAVSAAGRSTARQLRHLRARADVLGARMAGLPSTLVHGELYASNVIVGPPGPSVRVSPLDWEMAAMGPGLGDLAALTAGDWSDVDRRALETAYADELGIPVDHRFEADLDACRLARCIQWLGWQPRWRAPDHHARDWCAEAMELAERLEL